MLPPLDIIAAISFGVTSLDTLIRLLQGADKAISTYRECERELLSFKAALKSLVSRYEQWDYFWGARAVERETAVYKELWGKDDYNIICEQLTKTVQQFEKCLTRLNYRCSGLGSQYRTRTVSRNLAEAFRNTANSLSRLVIGDDLRILDKIKHTFRNSEAIRKDLADAKQMMKLLESQARTCFETRGFALTGGPTTRDHVCRCRDMLRVRHLCAKLYKQFLWKCDIYEIWIRLRWPTLDPEHGEHRHLGLLQPPCVELTVLELLQPPGRRAEVTIRRRWFITIDVLGTTNANEIPLDLEDLDPVLFCELKHNTVFEFRGVQYLLERRNMRVDAASKCSPPNFNGGQPLRSIDAGPRKERSAMLLAAVTMWFPMLIDTLRSLKLDGSRLMTMPYEEEDDPELLGLHHKLHHKCLYRPWLVQPGSPSYDWRRSPQDPFLSLALTIAELIMQQKVGGTKRAGVRVLYHLEDGESPDQSAFPQKILDAGGLPIRSAVEYLLKPDPGDLLRDGRSIKTERFVTKTMTPVMTHFNHLMALGNAGSSTG